MTDTPTWREAANRQALYVYVCVCIIEREEESESDFAVSERTLSTHADPLDVVESRGKTS